MIHRHSSFYRKYVYRTNADWSCPMEKNIPKYVRNLKMNGKLNNIDRQNASRKLLKLVLDSNEKDYYESLYLNDLNIIINDSIDYYELIAPKQN